MIRSEMDYPYAITSVFNASTKESMDVSMCRVEQSECSHRLICSLTRNDVPEPGECHVSREVYGKMVEGRCVCESFIIKFNVTSYLCVTHSTHHSKCLKINPRRLDYLSCA